jgi:hypothetical protein
MAWASTCAAGGLPAISSLALPIIVAMTPPDIGG